jgi:hypothetical protein
MDIKQIIITPNKEDSLKSTINLLIEENGEEKLIDAAGGFVVVAATDTDFYLGTQKNPILLFNFLTHELQQPDSYLANLLFTTLIAVTYSANAEAILRIYDDLLAITNMYAEQYDYIVAELDTSKEEGAKEEKKEDVSPPS